MPSDPSFDQALDTDPYENDPYRNRRIADHCKVTWQCPSNTATHSYLPYSSTHSQQHEQHSPTLSLPSPLPTLTTSSPAGFHADHAHVVLYKDTHQDSLLTTITTTARTASTLAPLRPLLHSTMTSLSLSEEIRKQKHKQDTRGWRLSGCCCQTGFSWKWFCFIVLCLLLLVSGVLLFVCLPRIPHVSMPATASAVGQLDWGPSSHPFYRSTWKLNLTLDNHHNFVPLHLLQTDLVLSIHPPDLMDTPFAWSSLPEMTLDVGARTVTAVFRIDYAAPTRTDPTFAHLYQACGPHLVTDPPPLNVSLQVTFHILNYPWLATTTVYPTDDAGLICPVN